MSSIQLPADGVGKFVETNTPDGTNHRQVVTVGDKSTAANTLAVDGSGRVTANINGTVAVRPTDGTNAITKTFDADTSGVTHEYVEGISLRKSASGGSVEAFTATNPGRIDPTGTTIQPVSWSGQSVTVTQGTGSNLHTVIDSGTVSTITNVVHVDDNAGSLTVDGTVTANISGSISNTSFGCTNLPTTVDTNSGVKSASTLRSVLATDQPALTTAGVFSVKIDQTTPGTTNAVSVSQGTATNLKAQAENYQGGAAVSSSNPLFTTQTDIAASGNITTQNLVPAGTATANSAVLSGTINGETTINVQVTGTYTGALSLQGTVDNSTWVTVGGLVFTNINTGAQTATIASGTTGIWQGDCAGYQQVRITALAAVTGTAVVTLRLSEGAGLVALDTALPSGTNTIGAVTLTAGTAGASIKHLVSAATTNLTNVKASAGVIVGWTIFNTNAATRYVKLHNNSGTPTVGSGVVRTIGVPAGGGNNYAPAIPIAFSTGIAFSTVTGSADNDTTAVGAGDLIIDIEYI